MITSDAYYNDRKRLLQEPQTSTLKIRNCIRITSENNNHCVFKADNIRTNQFKTMLF